MQVIADDPEGSVVRAVINSFINMEGSKPKSCDALLKQLLQRLARFAFDSSSLGKPKKKVYVSHSLVVQFEGRFTEGPAGTSRPTIQQDQVHRRNSKCRG